MVQAPEFREPIQAVSNRRRHPLAHCQECPLFTPDCTFVPSLIPANPKIAVVGEAPGYQEAQRGKPFSGPSGKLLATVLRHYKYKPSEVMLTNVCLCRPPGNATPPRAAVNSCRDRLIGELRESGASGVLALGGTAASALVDDPRNITNLRVGPAKDPTASLAGSSIVRVVPTWHPAYCLRSADNFPALVTDVGKLQESRRPPWRSPQFVILDDPDRALSALDLLRSSADKCVIDIEVGIEKDESFAHPNTYSLLCVGLAYRRGEALVFGENSLKDERVLSGLREFLLRTKIIAHNGKFDLAGLYPVFGGLELWFDTMLAHYALDERVGAQLHGLKVLAVEQLGAPQYDLEVRRYVPRNGNYADIPRPVLYKYNAYDAACTWDLFELFSERLDRDGVRRVHDHMVRASNQLMYLELNGITVDRAYSYALQGDYEQRLSEIESSLRTIGKVDSINPRSPKQLKEWFADHGYYFESTDVDHLTLALRRLPDGDTVRKFIEELLRYRREQKLYSTYVIGIRKRLYRGRVHTTYLLHGTTSGRLASRNPNLQNIVRDKAIKRQFSVSSPDNVFIHVDYKQAEGRVIATLAQDEYLRDIFSDPEADLFDTLASQLYGVTVAELHDGSVRAKNMRIRTKAYFYGLSYGRQAFSIAQEHNMPVREAEKMLRQFMELIPDTAAWQAETRRKVLAGDDLITPFGRKRRFHLITDENQQDVLNEALSFLPQSTASDICLSALTRLRPLLRGLGWLRLTIHDALVAECPERNRDTVAELMQRVMVEEGRSFTDYVPFEVDTTIGKHWGEL